MISKTLTVSASLLNVILAVLLYRAKTAQHWGDSAELTPGVRVPPLVGADPLGRPISIEYSTQVRTVLYVFSPGCGWCERNEKSLQRLARALRGKFRFFAISLDREGLLDWIHLQRPEYDIVTDLPYRAFLAYRFTSTPMTVVISPGGTVDRAWLGAYRSETVREIEKYFGVSLPQASPE